MSSVLNLHDTRCNISHFALYIISRVAWHKTYSCSSVHLTDESDGVDDVNGAAELASAAARGRGRPTVYVGRI